MNFLGHIFLSGNDFELMQNNLFGDFIKGKDLSQFPEAVQKGIILHRKIDDYIDHHPKVLVLKHSLQEELPKIASVAIDLYFDHLLAKNWEQYYPQNLLKFTNELYTSFNMDENLYNERFIFVLLKMIEKNWLWQYQNLSGLHKACTGVSNRISFPNELVNGVEVFKNHEQRIVATFETYMEEAFAFFNNYRNNF